LVSSHGFLKVPVMCHCEPFCAEAIPMVDEEIASTGNLAGKPVKLLYQINATNTRLHTVAEIRLGQRLPVREAAQPPTRPDPSQV
jgi:hypothetical protein